ncbi:NADPH-dependent FMN reductase [Desulfosarcina variabilis str. Montpellier]|uniref:flavodoxin family protein n=1 Tax=Desulfosarcina variabilis TaxID=2300 RepID=UPI003AFB2011
MNITHASISPGNNQPSKTVRVLGIGGSPRKGGNSDALLEQILKGVQEHNIDYRKVQLREYQYQGCIGCEKCRKSGRCSGLNDGMSLIYPYVIESQGLILISPTHNYNVTAWVKSFIDRLYCFYIFDDNRPRGWSSRLAGQGRKAVIGAVCEQTNKTDMGFTLEAMRYPLQALGYEIVGELPVYGIFDRAKVKDQDETMQKAIKLGRAFASSF